MLDYSFLKDTLINMEYAVTGMIIMIVVLFLMALIFKDT
jgi:hypothetical protein